MKAKIVLIHFPFTDLTDSKLRPALVIHESENDVVVAFISSKIPNHLLDSDTG
jgi:mRNA interferase MazF